MSGDIPKRFEHLKIMYLLPLAFIVSIALTIWFVFISEASVIAKVLVGALFVISFFLHPLSFPMAGFFLRIGISISVLFYQMYQTAKSQ
jgi:hypothetical protein